MIGASARRWRAGAFTVPVLAVLTYLLIAALAYWPVEPFSRSHILGCACSDPVQEIWFLAWPAYALRHGLNPFFTAFLNYPRGANLAANTSMPLLGIIGAPITWLRGPVATLNVLMRLSFALSATSMFFVVRRFTSWWPAAFGAGLLYGFSPYMVGQGFGHLFLTFVPLPPLMLLCAYTIVRGPLPVSLPGTLPGGAAPSLESHQMRRYGLRRGFLLGSLCVLQFFISIEVLVTTIVCALAVAVVAAAVRPRQAAERLLPVLWSAGAAVAVAIPFLAYPIWFFLRGEQHIVGPPHPISNLAPIKADLLGPVVPTLNQLLGPSHLIAIGTSYGAGDRPENGVYLGVALVVLLVYLVARCRRDHVVLLGAGLGLTGLVLSLGTPLVVNNHSTHIPLPFAVLLHAPFVQGVEALRFSLYEQLGAAIVLGVGLDRVRGEGWRLRAGARHRAEHDLADERSVVVRATGSDTQQGRRAILALLAGMVALAPLLPRYPYPSGPAFVPSYFLSGAVRAIAPGSVVLAYPYDVDPENDAMLWQASSGMRFKLFGGQVTIPGANGRASSSVASLHPSAMQQLFEASEAGRTSFALSPTTISALRSFLVRYDVGTVVVDPLGADPQLVLHDLAVVLAAPPIVTDGVEVWYRANATAARLSHQPPASR